MGVGDQFQAIRCYVKNADTLHVSINGKIESFDLREQREFRELETALFSKYTGEQS